MTAQMARLRLAAATFPRFPELTDDDRTIVPLLAREGIDLEPVLWDRPTSELEAYDAIVVRSVWDYHLVPDKFGAWLDALSAMSARKRIFNPPACRATRMGRFVCAPTRTRSRRSSAIERSSARPAAFACVAERPLYARVDGVELDGRLRLMELEVTEPHLYLMGGRGAVDRFAGALIAALR